MAICCPCPAWLAVALPVVIWIFYKWRKGEYKHRMWLNLIPVLGWYWYRKRCKYEN